MRNETVDIDSLVTSRSADRKIMDSIRITSRPPSRNRKCNQLIQFWRTFTKVISIGKDLSWSHYENEPRVQEKQQARDRQPRIFVFVACLTILSGN